MSSGPETEQTVDRVEVIIDIPRDVVERLAEHVDVLGGQVMLVTSESDQTGSICELAESDVKQSMMTREQFNQYGSEHGMYGPRVTRIWKAAAYLVRSMSYHDRHILDPDLPIYERFDTSLPESLNLMTVLASIREVEAGEISFINIGEYSWNVLAAIINKRIGEDEFEQVVLPFDPSIHPRLRAWSGSEQSFERSQIAIEELESRYKVAEYEATKIRSQIPLF